MCAMNPNCFCYCNFCFVLQFVWCRKISPQSSGRLLNEWNSRLHNHSTHEMGSLCLIRICAMSANLSQPQLLVVYYFIFMCRQSLPQGSGRLLNEWNLGQRNHSMHEIEQFGLIGMCAIAPNPCCLDLSCSVDRCNKVCLAAQVGC
jgi:hypothetical protein